MPKVGKKHDFFWIQLKPPLMRSQKKYLKPVGSIRTPFPSGLKNLKGSDNFNLSKFSYNQTPWRLSTNLCRPIFCFQGVIWLDQQSPRVSFNTLFKPQHNPSEDLGGISNVQKYLRNCTLVICTHNFVGKHLCNCIDQVAKK